MSLKLRKGSKQLSRQQCKATTKAGHPCHAPAVEEGLCFFHAHPEKLAYLGRQGGQMNRRWKNDASLPHKPLKTTVEVSELLEETINRIPARPIRSSCRECDWVLIRDSSESSRPASRNTRCDK
jgi:hypothetical protein